MLLSARWVLPIDRPPIVDGWIEISGETITGLGAGPPPAPARDLGRVAVLPGLVNAHTHLELSWMAGLIRPAESMDEWIRALLRLRRSGPQGEPSVASTIRQALGEMRETGTVLAGDVSNTLASAPLLVEAGVGGIVFHEVLGFNAADPVALVHQASLRLDDALRSAAGSRRTGVPRLGGRVVAHAPYSVSPALFAEIARCEGDAPLSVHLGESPEEMQFLKTGGGPIRHVLGELGVWSEDWEVPGCDPVEYMSRVGYLRPGMLAVHATHLDDPALERLAGAGAVVVTCPRSNTWVGAGLPRVAHFYAAGVPVAIGTDSLASVASLNLFDELAELRRIAPDVAAASLLESATRIGAEALGFGRTHGTIARGKHASLVAVAVPDAVTDVEEYLVGGVPPASIRLLS
jgi:cytosine/adenosine deaminase-related metal-dependent hydrolase